MRPPLPLVLLSLLLLVTAACGPGTEGEGPDVLRDRTGGSADSVSGAESDEAPAAGRDAPPAAGRPGAAGAVPPRGRAWVVFGGDTVRAEVARTSSERSRGLMYRESLPEDGGMLFVYDDEAPRSFWMENTLVPLDIAFLDSSLTVVDIQSMEPGTRDMHRSAAPAMFALEVNRGWFADHGVAVGGVAEIVFGAR